MAESTEELHLEDSVMETEESPNFDFEKFVCGPLKTVHELMSWEFCEEKNWFRPSVLNSTLRRPTHLSEVMVVHDMQGGYLDDRFVLGNNNNEAFRFYHWHLVDIFVYFAHHLVVIPPPAWIHVAHTNGVIVLGTFITEWKDGEAALEEILNSEESAIKAADQLLEICRKLRFEGWFINIENPVKPELLPRLRSFLRRLSRGGIYVVWYDSVISTGELKWQDELNASNLPFVEAVMCPTWPHRGRAFLNYGWTPDKLQASASLAVAQGIPGRCVHVGVDVFGRGCPGGGGWNSAFAVEAANRVGLGVGLFAPGWVFEVSSPGDPPFHERAQRFWRLLADLLGGPRPIVGALATNFSLGQGRGGPRTASNDLRRQRLMPHFYPEPGAGYALRLDAAEGLTGDFCLRVDLEVRRPVEVPLFATWRRSQDLRRFAVTARWCGGGRRALALLVKCRNQDVDVEESEEVAEKRRRRETTPDEELFRVFVCAVVEPGEEEEGRDAMLRRLRDYCTVNFRMDQLCVVPSSGVVRQVHASDGRVGDAGAPWITYSVGCFGVPGSLSRDHAFVCELGLLVWDLRPEEEGPDGLCLALGGLAVEWS